MSSCGSVGRVPAGAKGQTAEASVLPEERRLGRGEKISRTVTKVERYHSRPDAAVNVGLPTFAVFCYSKERKETAT